MSFRENIHRCVFFILLFYQIVTGLENDKLDITGLIMVQYRTVILPFRLINMLIGYVDERIN